MSGHMGGISRTVNYKGNRIDIGGHRFFSKSDRVMLLRRRLSRIYFMRRFFSYPIGLSLDTIRKLGWLRTAAIGFSCFWRAATANQDHSMLAAMTAVDNIVAGVHDRAALWETNTEQNYHEQKTDARKL
jgi:protoporphyrinogen oxidase